MPSHRTKPAHGRFLTVPEVARILKISEVTLYRAVRDLQFPAVKVRGRYTIPARALDDLEDAAMRLIGPGSTDDFGGHVVARSGGAL
jgi:excisionase family DNA binding protein